jgi:Zn-dependent peptidase ImmA (M78 family)
MSLTSQTTDDVKTFATRLAKARAASGLASGALAKAARVPESAVLAHERGEAMLSLGQLVRIARILGTAVAPFVDLNAHQELPLKAPEALLLAPAGKILNDRDQHEMAAMLRRAKTVALLRSILGRFEHKDLFGYHAPPDDRPYLSGYDHARKMRKAFGEAHAPIPNLEESLVDELGIFVGYLRFETPNVSAASCRSGDARLIVIADDAASLTARRKALGHELAHLAMDFPNSEGVLTDVEASENVFDASRPPAESRADAFAMMFLAPEAGVNRLLGPAPAARLSIPEAMIAVKRVHSTFGIGLEAAAWHLWHLKYLRSEDDAIATFSRPFARDLADFESAPRRDALRFLVVEALEKELISPAKAREYLDINAHAEV